jgi:hypothetical protein
MFDLKAIPEGLHEAERNGYSSATASLSHIMDLHASYLKYDEDEDLERIEEIVHEMPLSIEVRSDWYSQFTTADTKPSEFRILLSTGGPAVQIIGELSEHGEPECIKIQYQDWFLPWKALPIFDDINVEKALDWFCSRFYFGE